MMGDAQIGAREELEPESPKELWEIVMAHMENTNAALQDLKEALENFNRSAL